MNNSKSFPTICQVNIDGLSSHSSVALENFIDKNAVDVLAIQEVGSKEPAADIFKNMTTFYSYSLKGVSLSVANRFKPQISPSLISDDVDAVFVVCSVGKISVMFVSCYCRPEISSTKSLRNLLGHLDKAWTWCKSNNVPNMLVSGDFNARNVVWGDSTNNPRGKVLCDYVEASNDAILHSAGSNTFLHSLGGSVIDLSLSFGSISSMMSVPWTEHCYTLFSGAPLKGHIPVLQNIIIPEDGKESKRKVLDYDKADWASWHFEAQRLFRDIIDADIEDPAVMFDLFLDIMKQCSDKHIPIKTVCKHSKPFWSDNLSHLSAELQKAQKNYKKRSDPSNRIIMKCCRDTFRDALVTEKNSWIHRKLEGLNTKDCIKFWKRYKNMFTPKRESCIGHLYNEHGKLTQSDEDKEEILYETFFTGSHLRQQSFSNRTMSDIETHLANLKERNWDTDQVQTNWNFDPVSQSPEEILREEIPDIDYNNNFLNSKIRSEEVKDAIYLQKSAAKCHDMDTFHPILLKKLPNVAVRFLTSMFNSVIDKGKWIWDSSLVSFIRKADKDSYLMPGSYRPITIASYVGKILERVLQRRLILFCQKNHVIDDTQEGFLPQRNTTRYLYKMTAAAAEARRRRMSSIILFIDFEKAFDSVSTSAMIFKMNQHGISGKFLKLIDNFLNDRSVTLRVNNHFGPKRRVGKFGLPQGSVLSPLLFIIFVSDLLQDVHLLAGGAGSAAVFKYADDGSVMVSANTTVECYSIMQTICDSLTQWCQKWHLAINCNRNKTEAVILKSHDSQSSIIGQLIISGKCIKYTSSSKVLGVYMDEDMSFLQHAKSVLRSCWNRWHQLSDKTTRKRGLNCSSLTLLFKSSVLTKLLYAAPVWLNKNLHLFKDFYYRALFKISGSQYKPSADLLQVSFNLPPLHLCLQIMTIKFLLKAISLDDGLKALILQLEETPGHPYYQHVMWAKSFLSHAPEDTCSQSLRMRGISLLDWSAEELQYTQTKITEFMCTRWDKLLLCNALKHFAPENAGSLIRTLLIVQNPLFGRESRRSQDTDYIDFLHGHGLRFNYFKCKVKPENTDDTCDDCGTTEDTNYHKLFLCGTFDGATRDTLIQSVNNNPENFVAEVLFTETMDTRTSFKDMIRLICDQSLGDDHYEQSSTS